MNVVFRVGTIPSTPSEYAYFVYPGKEGPQVFFGSDDKIVLSEILTIFRTEEISCEPQLAGVAGELGLAVRELTPEEANYLGIVALDLAQPGKLSSVKSPAQFYLFGTSCKFYEENSPWRGPYNQETIGLLITGSFQRRLYARILGGGDTTPGLALYTDADAVARVVELHENQQPDQIINVDVLGVTLESKPAFAVDAMRRAYGLQSSPAPLRVEAGKHQDIGGTDLLFLSVAMRAVASLTVDSKEANAEVGVGDVSLAALAYV